MDTEHLPTNQSSEYYACPDNQITCPDYEHSEARPGYLDLTCRHWDGKGCLKALRGSYRGFNLKRIARQGGNR